MDDIDTIDSMFQSVMMLDDSNDDGDVGQDYANPLTIYPQEILRPVEVDENGVEEELQGLEAHKLFDDGGREEALNTVIDTQEKMQKFMVFIEKQSILVQNLLEAYLGAKSLFADQKAAIAKWQGVFNELPEPDQQARFWKFKNYVKKAWDTAMPTKTKRDQAYAKFSPENLKLQQTWSKWREGKASCDKLATAFNIWPAYFKLTDELITPYMVHGEVDPTLDNPSLKNERLEMWEDITQGHLDNEYHLNNDPAFIRSGDFWTGLMRWVEDRRTHRNLFFENRQVLKALEGELFMGSEREEAVVKDELRFSQLLDRKMKQEDPVLEKYR